MYRRRGTFHAAGLITRFNATGATVDKNMLLAVPTHGPGGSPYVQGESPKRLRRFVEAVITPGSLFDEGNRCSAVLQRARKEWRIWGVVSKTRVPARWKEALELYRVMVGQTGETRRVTEARLNKLAGRLGALSRNEWMALFKGCPRKVQRGFMVYVVEAWGR